MADAEERPIYLTPTIRASRKNWLARYQFTALADGSPIDLSSYTFAGSVALAKGGTALCSISFDNTLASGIVQAYLTVANSDIVYAAALAAGQSTVVWDIKGTPSGGEAEQWFEGESPVSEVVA